MSAAHIPSYDELLWPTLRAVRELGHQARIDEVDEKVVEQEGFSGKQMTVLHKAGPRSEIEYRLAWARTYLKGIGALDNPQRGVWVTTDKGKQFAEHELEPLRQEYLALLRAERRLKQEAAKKAGGDADAEVADGEIDDWREELLAALLRMDPAAFEYLSKRLLRAAGFINTNVTGRSGDGRDRRRRRLPLVARELPGVLPVQEVQGECDPDKVRDFRGAMAGRGDKGLLITTGTFTSEAKREATRDGAPPIDLIDGERLCELLKEHGLGVRTTTRTVEDVEVNAEFFATLTN